MTSDVLNFDRKNKTWDILYHAFNKDFEYSISIVDTGDELADIHMKFLTTKLQDEIMSIHIDGIPPLIKCLYDVWVEKRHG